jgi:hypothetical protein
MRVYRIRRCAGAEGGAHTYFHADVIAPNWWTALRAAKQGRVRNWRWIDTFDRSSTTYCRYVFLYRLDEGHWRYAAKPLTWRQYREWEEKIERSRVRSARRLAALA